MHCKLERTFFLNGIKCDDMRSESWKANELTRFFATASNTPKMSLAEKKLD